MEAISPQTKHDFINNSIRIEVLSKIICEDLNNSKNPNLTHLNDLENFLSKELSLLKIIKEWAQSH